MTKCANANALITLLCYYVSATVSSQINIPGNCACTDGKVESMFMPIEKIGCFLKRRTKHQYFRDMDVVLKLIDYKKSFQ